MKKYLLYLIAAVIFFPACDSDNDDDYPYKYIKGGGTFVRGNTVRFYYIDEQGKSLINPDDLSTLPVSYDTSTPPETSDLPKDYKDGFYNGNHNHIAYDEDMNLYYVTSSAYGDMEKTIYTFYIRFKDNYDKMDIEYRYTDKNVVGGKYHSKIISWKFNNTHVYSDNDNVTDKKVFVKKANGKTTVSLNYK